MDTIHLEELDAEALYALGVELGRLSASRPDIAHRLLIGVRDGMVETRRLSTYDVQRGFAEILLTLWKHWVYFLKDPATTAPIPFTPIHGQSGIGKI